MSEKKLVVDEESQHFRLDVFLTKNLAEIPSRTAIQKLIDTGQVTVNDKTVKAHYKVQTGDTVCVIDDQMQPPEDKVFPEDIPLNVFFDDRYFIVINKPVGMLIHPVHGCATGTLVNALMYRFKNLSDVQPSFRPGIVHRLDRETSGLIIVAKDNQTHVRLARQFEKRRVKKKYVALVKGTVEFDEGIIDAPLDRHPTQFDKKSVGFGEGAKEARTIYKVLKRFGKEATLVALYPRSGRTHQLRVHMTYLGHPILGDVKYGQNNAYPRMALHAQSIGFQHPHSKHFLEFATPLPKNFITSPIS